MAFVIATGDVWEVRVYSEGGNQIAVNTFHVKVTSVALPASTEQTVCDAFGRKWAPLIAAVIDENAQVLGTITRRLTPTKTKGRQTFVGAASGTRPGELMPGQVTALVKLQTDDPGAGKDGKIYIPFVSETDSGSDGMLTAAYITALTTLAGNFDATLGYNNSVSAEAFQGQGVIFRRATSTSSPITATVVKGEWATQHRRSFAGKGDTSPF